MVDTDIMTVQTMEAVQGNKLSDITISLPSLNMVRYFAALLRRQGFTWYHSFRVEICQVSPWTVFSGIQTKGIHTMDQIEEFRECFVVSQSVVY